MVSKLFTLLSVAPVAYGAALAATNTNLQTAFPASSGTTALAAVKTIAAGQSFDGSMKQWDRNPSTCNDQAEGGDADAVFLLEDGAVLSNVIIGPNNGEGVHCKGTCTLNNVWWTDVCEDAATFKQSSGTSYVNGGGARGAEDKYARKSTFNNVKVTSGKVVAGVNVNYGDSTTISNSCVVGGALCWLYQGNNNGEEPTKVGSGPSGTACATASIKTSGC
ncbi:pectate lyase-domain-containing protein [Diaporthe sp. PMI_573]|nr:pectate lyase-domain-containing protein [Diaporthaceae sp. PMI_573]